MGDLLADNDSDTEIRFTINKNFANKYTEWREKQVMRSLEDRLGDWTVRRSRIQGEEEESSSEDDEDARDLPKLEKSFYQVLSLVKNKDPRIYDENLKFYPDITSTSNDNDTKTDYKKCKKDKPFVLRDYERKLILEKNGELSDEEEEDPRASSPTYVEEQKALKDSFKKALQNSDEEEEEEETEGFGSLLKKKRKSEAELIKEEEEYKEWLKGRQKELKDKTTESDLKVLHDYWNDPNLDSEEVYLRDYILNKRYLDSEDEDYTPAHNEKVHDDCVLENDMMYVDEQESFENKYNFRFEEPDPEFIKRYPRSVETSLRRKDDRRKIKRQEIRERKEAEMEVKREEIKQLKALKKKEILTKIAKIKEITGNDDIDLKDEDLEDDFSPEKHDQKMQELFSDHYYEVVETKKPRCPEFEQDLEIEDWEHWQGKDEDDNNDNNRQHNGYGEETSWEQPQSEDPNFIMDCDYDPKAHLQEELTNLSKSKKKQRRRSKFAQAIAKEKPVFDPNNKKFEEYFDEYYKLDCEDVIGDLPCRFKYRKTTPNNYGLSVDEILRADVKELNKWCSLKKIVRHKPENVEKYEVQAYKQKGSNEALKKKILPSLFVSDPDQTEARTTDETGKTGARMTDEMNMKKQKKMKKRKLEDSQDDTIHTNSKKQKLVMNGTDTDNTQRKPKKKKKKEIKEENNVIFHKQKKIHKNSSDKGEILDSCHFRKKSDNYINKKKKKNNFCVSDGEIPISDARLKAYGIRPKKFKNKIKYGNKQNAWS